MLNTFSLALFVLLAAPQVFASQTIHVNGQDILVEHSENYAGTDILAEFEVSKPVTLQLARGNTFIAYGMVTLHKSGAISMVTSPEKQDIQWKMQDGTELDLDCGKRHGSVDMPPTARVVTFYENGEYRGGCALRKPMEFKTIDGGSVIAGLDDLELNDKGQFQYARNVSSGSIVITGQKVNLEPASSLNLFPDGKANFFTMQKGESFFVEFPLMGKIQFGQREGKVVSTTLTKKGYVERGILAQEFEVKDLGFILQKGTGIAFDPDGFGVAGILFEQPYKFETGAYTLMIKSFVFDIDGTAVLKVENGFYFSLPMSSKLVSIPPGSEVKITSNKEIVGIRSPMQR